MVDRRGGDGKGRERREREWKEWKGVVESGRGRTKIE